MDAVYTPTIDISELPNEKIASPTSKVISLDPGAFHTTVQAGVRRGTSSYNHLAGSEEIEREADEIGQEFVQRNVPDDVWVPTYMRHPDDVQKVKIPPWSETLSEMKEDVIQLMGGAWSSMSENITWPSFMHDCAQTKDRDLCEWEPHNFPDRMIHGDFTTVLLASKMRMVTNQGPVPNGFSKSRIKKRVFDHQRVHHAAASEKWYFLTEVDVEQLTHTIQVEEEWNVDHRCSVAHVSIRCTNSAFPGNTTAKVTLSIRSLANTMQTAISGQIEFMNIVKSQLMLFRQVELNVSEIFLNVIEVLQECVEDDGSGKANHSIGRPASVPETQSYNIRKSKGNDGDSSYADVNLLESDHSPSSKYSNSVNNNPDFQVIPPSKGVDNALLLAFAEKI